MKKVITIMGIFGLMIVQAQVGINNDNPEATLDIKSEGNTNATKALKITNSAGTEMVTVINDGKVGIGTHTPNSKFHVDLDNDGMDGDDIYMTSLQGQGILSIGIPPVELKPFRSLQLANRVEINATYSHIIMNESDETGSSSSILERNVNRTSFGASDGTTAKNIITYLDDGKVGIGTDSPTEKLEVKGAIKVGSNSTASGVPAHVAPAGTIIFHNGSFYGNTDGTATGWKKLHN